MNLTTETPELIEALCKAQAKFKPAIKDKENPFFKKNYADLNSVWLACKDELAANDLFVSQIITSNEGKNSIKTRVYHKSGGYIESELDIISKNANDPQSLGSGITYMRRYSLAAILGIIVDDDDGEEAMARNKPEAKAQPKEDTSKIKNEYRNLLMNSEHVFSKDDIKKFADSPGWTMQNYVTALNHIKKLKKEREEILQAEHHEN